MDFVLIDVVSVADVASVVGSVRLTLLREAVVPPPMCAWEVHLADVVDSVAFQHGHSARFGVVSRGSRIDCFEVTTAIVEASEGEIRFHRFISLFYSFNWLGFTVDQLFRMV